MMIRWVVALILLGCPAPAAVCTHLETRCADNVAQLCDTRGQWQDVVDCEGVASPTQLRWSCVEDDEGDHVCLPDE